MMRIGRKCTEGYVLSPIIVWSKGPPFEVLEASGPCSYSTVLRNGLMIVNKGAAFASIVLDNFSAHNNLANYVVVFRQIFFLLSVWST